MKINLNNKEYLRCAEFLDIKEYNICAANIYIDYLTNHYNDISKAKDEKDFYQGFLKCLDIDEYDPEYKLINGCCKLDQISKLKKEIYEIDKYYKLIKNINAKEDNWKLTNLKYNAFEGFVCNELDIDDKGFSEHTPLGYFEEEFVYPAVIENDTIWMSIIPHEIETMKQPIKNAEGRVLVLGLGLGYYLFHIANKKDVTDIDVIELDKRVISIFNNYLFEKFPNKEKINIIQDDGIEYLKKNKKKYDYVFVDIWHNVGDGEMLYLKIKALENQYPSTMFDYWIERSTLSMLRRQVLTIYSETLEGFKEKDYLLARNNNDLIINKLYFYLKNVEINSYDDLHDLLKEESLKEIAKNLF